MTGKNKAEAEKISGVDTRAQEATIDNLIAQTSNEKVKKGLIRTITFEVIVVDVRIQ